MKSGQSVSKKRGCSPKTIGKRLLFTLLFVGNFSFHAHSQTFQEQAKVQYYESRIGDPNSSTQQQMALYDSIISYYSKIGNSAELQDYKFRKMDFCYESGEYLAAYKTGLELIGELEKKSNLAQEELQRKNYAHLIVGKACRNLGMYDESVFHLFSIIQNPDKKYAIEACSYLGFVFMQMQQMEKSKQYNFRALQLLSAADSAVFFRSASVVYNNMGGYYYNQKPLDSALYFLNRSIQYYDYSESIFSKSYIYHNMAIIYQEMGEYEMAEDYLRKAIETSQNEPYNLARFLQNLAFLLFEQERWDEAESYYLEALEEAEKTGNSQLKSSILIEISDLFHEKKLYEKAWRYLKEGVALQDSAFNNENLEKIALLSQQFDNYRITTEKELLEKELQLSEFSNQRKTILVIALASLLLILTVLAIIIIRKILKSSAVNVEKNTQETKEEVRKEYETALEEKNRKLASNALFLMKTNEMLTSLEKGVKQQLATDDPKKLKEIAREMANIVTPYSAGQGWEEFRLYFEQVHRSFYKSLYDINPDLSKMELRLAALLALNMNTKEIAQVTNRSVRTIETLIYRLRKNLDIPPNERTFSFLQKFLDE